MLLGYGLTGWYGWLEENHKEAIILYLKRCVGILD
jgi:hypothetical protein